MNKSERYVVVSSDCHAGADLWDYKEYLPTKWHDEFDAWASTYQDPWSDEVAADDSVKMGSASWDSDFSWDGDKRIAALDGDGIAAELLFPNTAPPFFPTAVLSAPGPRTREEYERRWAGLQAHNRWMVDFCSTAPNRRVGLAQVFLTDVEDTVREIRWAAEAGLRGVLLPSDSPGTLVPLYYPRYDAIWKVCEELQMPIHRHATFPADEASPEYGIAGPAVGLVEANFFSARGVGHLIFAGVFDRFPGLKFVMTEGGTAWVVNKLAELDAVYDGAMVRGSIVDYFAGDAARTLKRRPSEYFATNCYIGASLLSAPECQIRHQIGVDNIMWGSDLPHREGSYPYTRETYRAVFHDVPPEETAKMLGLNAVSVYRLDLEALRAVADRIGPTVEEVAQPLLHWPKTPEETVHPGLFNEFMPGYAVTADAN